MLIDKVYHKEKIEGLILFSCESNIKKYYKSVAFLSKPIVIVLSLVMLGLFVLKESFFGNDEESDKSDIKYIVCSKSSYC